MSMLAKTDWISPPDPDPEYPSSDGKRMAESTTQYDWMVRIKGAIDLHFRENPAVFVAGDLLWYPVEGSPSIRMAPDVLVVFGRPKGPRGAYIQHREGGVPIHVVFEVLSPGNRAGELKRKLTFYERYRVDEYYIYDPNRFVLKGYLRNGPNLAPIAEMRGWVSPRLGLRFEMPKELELSWVDGSPFLTMEEMADEQARLRRAADEERLRADSERKRANQERQKAERERQKAESERQKAEHASQAADRLREQLRALGIEPDS